MDLNGGAITKEEKTAITDKGWTCHEDKKYTKAFASTDNITKVINEWEGITPTKTHMTFDG